MAAASDDGMAGRTAGFGTPSDEDVQASTAPGPGHFTDLYRQYLLRSKQWDEATVDSLMGDVDAVFSRVGEPHDGGCFDRRGLVVADVQSGKTSNYVGLMARAADAGYRVIIVLAGLYNDLRGQTQERVEEGFVGEHSIRREPVGVGTLEGFDEDLMAYCLTGRDHDFDPGIFATLMDANPDHDRIASVFVVKKNALVLDKLIGWLERSGPCVAGLPLLLIDDEADNASINVRYGKMRKDGAGMDISRINRQIRTLLTLFDQSAYVGYTATPFANVLINSRDSDEDAGDDIFPRSFIYTLGRSSQYFGAATVFGDIDSPTARHYRAIDDADALAHPDGRRLRKGDTLGKLPESLQEALRTFVLACATRVLDGQGERHMSMMVNLSPWNTVQESTAALVGAYLGELRRSIKQADRLPESMLDDERLLARLPALAALKRTWMREYPDRFSWPQVLGVLERTVHPMRVVTINSQSPDTLDYQDAGAQRVIAVGGYRLSRGLTLEGLMVSYYARNARSYDSLMQMARWFGYRAGYEPLCRVWMTYESAAWYREVADITDELMQDIRRMCQEKATPLECGMRIRCSPGALLVTAPDKMGEGRTITNAKVDLDGAAVHTTAFDRDPQVLQANEQAAIRLLERIGALGMPATTPHDPYGHAGLLARGVAIGLVEGFLGEYHNSPSSPRTDSAYLLEHLRRIRQHGIGLMDVYVASGSAHAGGEDFPALRSTVVRMRRRPAPDTTAHTFFASRRSISDGYEEQVALTETELEAAARWQQADTFALQGTGGPESSLGVKGPTGWYCRQRMRRPLLVLRPLALRYREHPGDGERRQFERLGPDVWPDMAHVERTVGWSLSFPYLHLGKPVTYCYDDAMWRAMLGQADTMDEDDDSLAA